MNFLSIHTPPDHEIFEIQKSESAFYWSKGASILFNKWGICLDSEPSHDGVIATRYTNVSSASSLRIVEAPLHPHVAKRLHLDGHIFTCKRLFIEDQSQRQIGELNFSEFSVRKIPLSREEKTYPYHFVSSDSYWNNNLITVQDFTSAKDWVVLATAITECSQRFPAVLVKEGCLVFAVPFFDLLVAAHARPQLNDGFYALEVNSDAREIEDWLSTLVLSCFSGHSAVVTRWPTGYNAALTVRFDYDRSIDKSSFYNLLDLLDQYNVKCSCFFMTRLLPLEQIRLLLDRGHEVGIHSEARCWSEFASEYHQFCSYVGVVPSGYTAHGGIGAAGHLGETQHIWAEKLGLLYGEMLSFPVTHSHRAISSELGIPRMRQLMLTPSHESLDLGTRPEAHALDYLLKKIPNRFSNGEHVVVMNHPDIHREELKTLLCSLDLDDIWSPRLVDAAAWANSHNLSYVKVSHKLHFSRPLPLASTLMLCSAKKFLHSYVEEVSLYAIMGDCKDVMAKPSIAYFSNTKAQLLDDFGSSSVAQVASKLAIAFTTSGPFNLIDDELNIYSLSTCDSYNKIEIGRSLRFFEEAWSLVFLSAVVKLLAEDGEIIVPFYPINESVSKGYWSKKWLQDAFGDDGTELAGNRLVFPACRIIPQNDSILAWFLENMNTIKSKSVSINSVRAKSISDLSLMYENVLYPGAPLGPIDFERTFTIEEELSLLSYSLSGANYKSAIIRRILSRFFSINDCLSLVDFGGDYGQVATELLLDSSNYIGKACVVEVSPTKLALASELKNYFFPDKDVFRFRLQPAQSVVLDEPVNVITFIGSLLYVPKNDLNMLLSCLWDKIRPGGLLIIHENIKNPRYKRDYKYMFEEEELESLLSPFGDIRYFLSSAAIELPREKVTGKTVFRVIKKT